MISFETLTEYFKNPLLVPALRTTMETLVKNCMTMWKDTPLNLDRMQFKEPITNSNARVFLAGFMIALHPTNLFRTNTPETTALTEAAIKVTEQFNKIMDILIDHHLIEGQDATTMMHVDDASPGETVIFQSYSHLVDAADGFCDSIRDFHNQFIDWKRADQPRVIHSIFDAMCSLVARLIHHSGDDYSEFDQADPLVMRINAHIADLRKKMGAITGIDSEEVQRYDEAIKGVIIRRYQTRVLREEHSRYLAANGLTPTGNPCFDFIES